MAAAGVHDLGRAPRGAGEDFIVIRCAWYDEGLRVGECGTQARGSSDPMAQQLARMTLAGLPRGGGDGDAIRHGILNVMRENGIREGHRPVSPLHPPKRLQRLFSCPRNVSVRQPFCSRLSLNLGVHCEDQPLGAPGRLCQVV